MAGCGLEATLLMLPEDGNREPDPDADIQELQPGGARLHPQRERKPPDCYTDQHGTSARQLVQDED